MEKLKQRIAELGLESYYERTKHYLRNAIHMEYTLMPEGEIPVGSSKLGGHPDLPAELERPRQEEGECLEFLRQLDSCADVGWIWDEGYGRVYFRIEEEDLKNRRFDRVLAVSQTS